MSGSTQSEGSISMATSDLTISWTMVGKLSPSTSSKMHPVRWGGGRGRGRGGGRGEGRWEGEGEGRREGRGEVEGYGEGEGRGEGTPHQSHKCCMYMYSQSPHTSTSLTLSPSHPYHPHITLPILTTIQCLPECGQAVEGES